MAFWRAALALYARPGAQAALLDLQDRRNGDVMAALWALAAAAAGRRLGPSEITRFEAATATARAEATRLRVARRAAKAGNPEGYRAAQAAELAAERTLAAAAADPGAVGARDDTADRQALARDNLTLATLRLSPPPSPAEIARLAAILFD